MCGPTSIISIAAIKIRGNRILTSERFEVTVRPDADMRVRRGSRFIACVKPMLHRARLSGRCCPVCFISSVGVHWSDITSISTLQCSTNTSSLTLRSSYPTDVSRISKLYYERKYGDAPANTVVDLSFASMLKDLGIPPLDQHDAFNDALMTAMMYVALRDMKERDVRIARPRAGGAILIR